MQPDDTAEALLDAVRELRTDLARMCADAERDELDRVLAETEDDIVTTGRCPEPARLARLRALLEGSRSLVPLFSSAGVLLDLVR